MYLPLKIIKIVPKMSFPPGPPLPIPGMPPPMIPPPYGMPPMGPMIPMTVGMMPGPMMGPVAMTMPPLPMPPHSKMTLKKPNIHHTTYKRENQETPDIMKGPPVTVFVGNITERAPDNLVRQILQFCLPRLLIGSSGTIHLQTPSQHRNHSSFCCRCGIVLNWKRVQGANGKLQAFGFCEYGEPEAALRAIRLLHDYELGNKKLVVKVDAKTKEKLDEYKAKVWAKQDDEKEVKEVEKEEGEESDDTLDEMTKQRDEIIRGSLESLIRSHEVELSKPVEVQDSPPQPIIHHQHHHINDKTNHKNSNQENNSPKPRIDFERRKTVRSRNELDEMDLEDDKKSLIHREIDKFRDTYKRAEEEKEKEKDTRSSSSSSRTSRRREYESPEPPRTRDRDRSDRDRDRDRRHRDRPKEDNNSNSSSRRRRRSRERSNRSPRESPVVAREIRERSRERERERPVERSRSASRDKDWAREREHSTENRTKEKEYDKEEEEEAYERKKQERKLREKEAVYQERLRNWEARERRKIKDYEKDKAKADEQKKDEAKEARRLKEFLEDYDDERDDPKYFKGSALLRRMKEREKEMEDDVLDRQREREELDELRKKLAEEGHPDPEAEVERFLQEESRLVEPPLKEETPDSDQEPERELPRAKLKPIPNIPVSPAEPSENIRHHRERKLMPEDDNTQNSFSAFADLVTHEEAKPLGFTSLRIGGSPTQTAASPAAAHNMSGIATKRKMTVDEVFNANDEDETEHKKKRKLIPLDDSQDDPLKAPAGAAQMSMEEKRKHIKSLIEKIPTEKKELFAYTLDWTMVDKVLMEKRIRPWINKKIIEYIGEEEPTLVEFICSKVMTSSDAQSILDDVSMVLDEEAEVFVVKMWRLLIYEIEAKKLGLPENSQGKS